MAALFGATSLVALGVAYAPEAGAVAGGATPVLQLTPSSVRVGGQVLVDAESFPPGAAVNVQLCGDGGLDGSAGCDEADTFTAVTSEVGHFAQYLTIGTPPQPCPCVVQAVSPSLGVPATVPITVVGLPSAAPTLPASPSTGPALAITSASLVLDRSLPATFGASVPGTLTFVVRNSSAQPVSLPPLLLKMGPASALHQLAFTPVLGSIPPHQVQRFHFAVNVPRLTWGSYLVTGQFLGLPATASFSVGARMTPWLLILLLALLAAALVEGSIRLAIAVRGLALEPVLLVPGGHPMATLGDDFVIRGYHGREHRPGDRVGDPGHSGTGTRAPVPVPSLAIPRPIPSLDDLGGDVLVQRTVVQQAPAAAQGQSAPRPRSVPEIPI